MVLFGRSKVSAGLDIGSGFVKLVAIDHSGPEPEIARVVITQLVEDAIVEGEVVDPVVVSETVRSVLEEAGLKAPRLVAAVGGHDVIIKTITTDRVRESDAEEVIRWEASQHVPFDMDSVQLDYQILDPEAEEPEMRVLLVAAKRELVEHRLGLLSDAGLSPGVLDVDAFALYNAFERNHPEAMAGLVAHVHIGHENTHINLLDEGLPILVRDVPFGSRRLREALQRERGLTVNEAEEVIRGRSQLDGLADFVSERIEELAVGVERASAFILAQSGAQEIGAVYASGGACAVPGLVDALAARLGVRTQVANPIERIGVMPEVMQTTELDEIAPTLMLAVGLALRTA